MRVLALVFIYVATGNVIKQLVQCVFMYYQVVMYTCIGKFGKQNEGCSIALSNSYASFVCALQTSHCTITKLCMLKHKSIANYYNKWLGIIILHAIVVKVFHLVIGYNICTGVTR